MKSNILLLTPDSPFPSASGAAIRNYGIVRGLHDAGHHVTLLSFCDAQLDRHSNPLYDLCKAVHFAPLPRHSKFKRILKLIGSANADMEFRLESEEYAQKLADILRAESFDFIQFSGIELGGYLDRITARKRSAKVVYDALNAESELQRMVAKIDRQQWERLPAAVYSTIQAGRLQRFERRTCETVDAVIAVSEEDRDHLAVHNGAPVFLMPNGIFTANYPPVPQHLCTENQLIFTGKMDYRPNVDAMEWFCTSVLPAVFRECPGTVLTIVGRNPHPRIQALATDDRIRITGWVDSVQPFLQSATLFVVPLRMGSGTRLKILEAMAAGCAVVSTSIGASGLHADVRHAMIITDGATGFSQSVISLLGDANRRATLGVRARKEVSDHYDWAVLIPHLLQAYEDIGLG